MATGTEPTDTGRGPRWWATAAVVAVVAFLPFVRGFSVGASFHFRDLSRYFLPIRLFVLEGLRQGDVRYWNPFVLEGEPVLMPPIGYPPDLLQVLWPSATFVSFVLALHVPLAALAMLVLLSHWRLRPSAAACGALAYALGGFCLSALSPYIHLQAVAWAPLMVWAVRKAALGTTRDVARGALVVGMALSTTGVEVAGQGLLIAALVAPLRRPAWAWARAAACVVIGAALAAVPLAMLFGVTRASSRGAGLPTALVLTYSVHPVSLLQTVLGNLHGDLTRLFDHYWGAKLASPFPYFVSLYFGPSLLCLAVTGALASATRSARWILIALVGVWLSLGHWGGWGLVLEALPALRVARFPVKAFFLVHFAVAVLGALGLDAIVASRGRATRLFTAIALGLGGLLTALPWLPSLAPGAGVGLQQLLFVGGTAPEVATESLANILRDASLGGLLCLVAGAVGVLVSIGRFPADRLGLTIVALIATDLLRTGAGLNPMAAPRSLLPSAEARAVAQALRNEGGRIFTCDLDHSRTYRSVFRDVERDRDLFALAAFQESLTPYLNVGSGVPSALSRDLSRVTPSDSRLSLPDTACAAPEALPDPLREAGVTHVIAPARLEAPALTQEYVLASRRIAPLSLYVYHLSQPLPLRAVATDVVPVREIHEARRVASPAAQQGGLVSVEGRLPPVKGAQGRVLSVVESPNRVELLVEADRPTVVVVRDAFAPGWSALANGVEAPVLRANGRHRAIPIGAGRTRVVLSYRPPTLRPALLLTLLAIAVVGILWRWPSPAPSPAR